MTPSDASNLTAFFDAETLDVALRGAGLVVFSWELPDGEVVFSGELSAVFGLDGHHERMVGQQSWELVHPEDREAVTRATQEGLRRGDGWTNRYRAVWPDGSLHPTEVVARIVTAPDGTPQQAVGVVRNLDGEQAREEARAQLDGFFSAAPVGLAFYDADLRYLRINAILAAANGLPVEAHLGRRPSELFASSGAGIEDMLRRTLAGGVPALDVPFTGPGVDGTGERHFLASFYPVVLPEGAPLGVGVVATDVTERVLDERERQRMLERTAFMAAASSILDDALDVDRTLQAFAELCVAELAAWCSITLAGADGEQRTVAVHHRDPALVALAFELEDRFPPDPAAASGVPQVLRSGEPVLWPEITDEVLVASAVDDEHLQILRSLELASAILVPLAARGQTFGVLTLVAEGDRRYDEADLELAIEVGKRAARAVDAARLYRAAKTQERATEEARALLDAFIETAPVGIAVFDADLRYVRVNAALAEINGVSAAEHIGKRVSTRVPGVREGLERVLQTGTPMIDVELVASPGPSSRSQSFLVSYFRVPDADGGFGVGTTVVDISDRLEAEQALRSQRDLYETLLRAQSEMGEAFVLIEGERILYVNAAAERIAMRSAQELYDLRSFRELVEGELPADPPAQRDVGLDIELRTPGGATVPVEVAVAPMIVDGRRRLVVVARDISERRREELERDRLLRAERLARRETELAHRRARTLAALSDVLDRSMALQATLPRAAELLVGEAPIVAIGVLARGGTTIERVAQAAADAERNAALRAFDGTTFELDPSNPTALVVLTGEPAFRGDVPIGMLRAIAEDPAQLEILQRVAGRSISTLPLVARGRTVGVMTLSWDEPGLVPEGTEREHLLEIARRLALGIDNAQLYAERAHIASTLQAGLLPGALPEVEGLEAAARYLPAGEAIEVGGDFYDLFRLGADAWAVVVGDVCGKGAEAAAVTAMARYTLRAASVAGPTSPGSALGLLNVAMGTEEVADRFLTAVLGHGRRDPTTGVVTLTLACAGHPPPVVLRVDGGAEAVECRGVLLGIGAEAVWEEQTVTLEPGDAIVLYTDGVTEASRSKPLSASELAAALVFEMTSRATTTADDLVDAVRALAERRAGGPLRDDVAIVALRAM